MKDNIIRNKTYAFALKIIELYKFLKDKHMEFVISKQVLRCGTSIGAMVKESEHAESTADFIHKLNVALKEANETEYWLQLLKDSRYIDDKMFQTLTLQCSEIIKILASIIKTTKNKIK